MREVVIDILTGLGITDSIIKDDSRLRADLELDSTELVEVSLELKRRLGVDVALESPADICVADLVEAVKTQVGVEAQTGK
jgi:acyl carrier protein